MRGRKIGLNPEAGAQPLSDGEGSLLPVSFSWVTGDVYLPLSPGAPALPGTSGWLDSEHSRMTPSAVISVSATTWQRDAALRAGLSKKVVGSTHPQRILAPGHWNPLEAWPQWGSVLEERERREERQGTPGG